MISNFDFGKGKKETAHRRTAATTTTTGYPK